MPTPDHDYHHRRAQLAQRGEGEPVDHDRDGEDDYEDDDMNEAQALIEAVRGGAEPQAALTEAARTQYRWKVLTIVPGHRRNIRKILEVIGAQATGFVSAMTPDMPDYAKLAKKYGRGRDVNERGMKGKITMKGGKRIFVGNVMGIGDCIIANSGFKA